MNKAILSFLLIVSFLLVPCSGHSSYIAMVIETTVTASPEKVEVRLTVQNNGDEPAYRVYPELRLGTDRVGLESQKIMAVKASRQWTHTFLSGQADLEVNGTYPLLVMLHYHDRNMYAYSMAEVVLFDLVAAGKKKALSGTIETTDVTVSGQAVLDLSNNSGKPIPGSVRLFLPEELNAGNSPAAFRLEPNQRVQLHFPINNNGALPNSTYSIFAITEYDDSGSHYTMMASGVIAVKEYKEEGSVRPLIIGSLIFIIFLFLLTAVFELRRREN